MRADGAPAKKLKDHLQWHNRRKAVENGPKAKAVGPADSVREEGVNAAEVPGRVARRKLLEIGLDKAAAVPAAVAAGARVAAYPNLRLEQVHEKQAHTRRRKPRKHAAPGWHVSARAMAMQIEVANRAKRETQ
jgi:hypothetical protein